MSRRSERKKSQCKKVKWNRKILEDKTITARKKRAEGQRGKIHCPRELKEKKLK